MRLFIQLTNLDRVVFPTPEAPTRSRCPRGYLSTLSILNTWSNTESKTTIGTDNSSSLNVFNLATIYSLNFSLSSDTYYLLR